MTCLLVSSLLQAIDLSNVLEDGIEGAGKAPNNPTHNSTALITANGDFYGATVVDIRGRDPAIYRSMGTSTKLRTVQYDSKWLNGKLNETTKISCNFY